MNQFSQRREVLLRLSSVTLCAAAVCFGLLGASSPFAYAAETVVKNADEATRVLGDAKPGDTVLFEDGDYDLGRLTLTQAGTETAPLIVRARQAGKVRFVGKTGFVFKQAGYVTLQGFDFATEDVPPVEILSSHYVRVTENRFHPKEPGGKGTFRWVRITDGTGSGSHHNRIDHNLFEEKHTIGNFVSVDGNGLVYPKGQISQYDRIDHNQFRNIGPRVPNGMEAIRVGLSGLSLSSGFTVIENNLFENCDGDPEVVSIKTSDAVVRNNVFRACQGGLCLRHGNRNRVENNQFFGDGKLGSNGVRVYGDDHVVENNTFFGLTSFALAVSNGDADYGADYTKSEPLPVSNPDKLLKLHLRPRRIMVRKNTVVNCAEAIVLGAPFGSRETQKPAQDVRFENNTVVAAGTTSGAKLVWIRTAPERLVWRGNVLYASKAAETGLPAGTPAEAVKVVRGEAPKTPLPPSRRAGVGPAWLL